ncbi:MAG: T9SS C-terminal target domain-containing protein [Chitinophagia bacterium]|nr:T9SS C-terminal target domain-containing protein [Chitinophagia bacterium]
MSAVGNIFFDINDYDFNILKNPGSTGEVTFFPNPAHGNLQILTGSLGEVKAVIYAADGRKIWQDSVNGLATIDVSSWSGGVYFVRTQMVIGGNEIKVKKILID